MKNHRLKPLFKNESGLSLIEIMAAIMIFMVVAAGVAGTLISGLRGTAHAGMATMGKAAAQEQVEEMRGRVFYVPYDTDPTVGTTADIDLLDRYYPDVLTAPSTSIDERTGLHWTGWYTYTGGDAYYTMESSPDDDGIVRTIETRFVDDSLSVIIPPADYDTDAQDVDAPPTNLVKVTVTTTWQYRGDEKTYTLDTLISGTGQQPPEESSGCLHSSNSSIEVEGGSFIAYTGTSDPYTTLVTGSLGRGYATGAFGCTSTVSAVATGGEQTISGTTYKGAEATVAGPPDGSDDDGPVTVGPPGTWPKYYFGNSSAEAEVESESGGFEVEAEAEVQVGTQTLQLSQIDGVPSGGGSCNPPNCRRWDFINPVITVTGGSEEQVKAKLEQVDGTATATGEIEYQQVNILPLQAVTSETPSASQGLVFIRNFTASSTSEANGIPGGASNELTYGSPTPVIVGMFNTSKSSSCSGDACYDL
ncbi:MAG: prepilin-type N-terminal cleavage/methylation domain-containing protein, partial [Actinomycetota bacterium]